MRAQLACVVGCDRMHRDIPMCSECRKRLSAPFGMSFNRYSAIAAIAEKRSLPPATPNGTKGSVRAAHKNQTWKYMRVRDRVGINAATPSMLLAVCKSHATPYRDPMLRGTHTPEGWE